VTPNSGSTPSGAPFRPTRSMTASTVSGDGCVWGGPRKVWPFHGRCCLRLPCRLFLRLFGFKSSLPLGCFVPKAVHLRRTRFTSVLYHSIFVCRLVRLILPSGDTLGRTKLGCSGGALPVALYRYTATLQHALVHATCPPPLQQPLPCAQLDQLDQNQECVLLGDGVVDGFDWLEPWLERQWRGGRCCQLVGRFSASGTPSPEPHPCLTSRTCLMMSVVPLGQIPGPGGRAHGVYQRLRPVDRCVPCGQHYSPVRA
jgi:hypothetical protein